MSSSGETKDISGVPQRLQDKITQNMDIVRERVDKIPEYGIDINSVAKAYMEYNLSVIGNLYSIFGSYDDVDVLDPIQFVNDVLQNIKSNK